MQFLSPTINMFINRKAFIRFASNLKYYLSLDIHFIESDRSFPVARCGDVTLFFNHCSNEEEAKAAWDRRKERVNYDNLYFIFYSFEGLSTSDLDEINRIKCKNKILLTDHPIDCDYAMYINTDKLIKDNPKLKDEDVNFLEKDLLGMRLFEKEWDFVSWLNR